MNKYWNIIKEKLTTVIKRMSKNPAPYVKNPGKDFTRNRKLPFETVVKLLISMGGNSIYKELLEAQGYAPNTVTASAFVQQREKLSSAAFEHLLHEFNNTYTAIKKYHGYRLLAVDGSYLHFATNPDDPDTYAQTSENVKGYNQLQLNVLYDLCNRLYIDATVQTYRHRNESRALADMVDRSIIDGKVIVIADRGFESYNNFAHIERRGWNYLTRVKDVGSNGILGGLKLPSDGEFDITVRKILTRKQTKYIRTYPDIYRFMPQNSTFDFLKFKSNDVYPISFRVVRLKINDDFYETFITNLTNDEFSLNEIKNLYPMRWGVETSFRDLKYSVGLLNFHAKKQEYIVQEIFARIIMYNFAEMVISQVIISQPDANHDYQVNFTVALFICKHFLRLSYNIPSPDIEALIRKNILPIRPGRKNKRVIHFKSAVSFVYRVS